MNISILVKSLVVAWTQEAYCDIELWMWIFWKYFIFILHGAMVVGLAAYGCHRLWLLFAWIRYCPGRKSTKIPTVVTGTAPMVTIQLPLYNERFVADRLIAAIASLEWPKNRFEIQVLDDSTDDTKRIVQEEVEKWRQKGISIHLIRRSNRAGFKAGALDAGLKIAQGEFIAVFDADFLPTPDFLQRTIPHFSKPEIGMVQARWGFLNDQQSWLTRIQSILISPHFGIEHQVRFTKGLFFNFNGTAGIWRRKAIETAGGWRNNTVTEDLDLSYRSQMEGWRFVYLNDVVVPSEIPSTFSAFRTQQQRWAKGSIQTARMILPKLLLSSYPLKIKLEACAHLLANFGWLFGAMSALLLYPAILSRPNIGPFQLLRFDIPLMTIAIGAVLLFFCCYGFRHSNGATLAWLPLVPLFSIGIAPSLALSVIQGLFTRGGHFKRTPKFGHLEQTRLAGPARIYHQPASFYFLLDLGLATYSLLPIYFAWQQETWAAIPFLLFFPTGFLLATVQELKDLLGPPNSIKRVSVVAGNHHVSCKKSPP